MIDPKMQIYADGNGVWRTLYSGAMDRNDRFQVADRASKQPPSTGWLFVPPKGEAETPSAMRIIFNSEPGSDDPG